MAINLSLQHWFIDSASCCVGVEVLLDGATLLFPRRSSPRSKMKYNLRTKEVLVLEISAQILNINDEAEL